MLGIKCVILVKLIKFKQFKIDALSNNQHFNFVNHLNNVLSAFFPPLIRTELKSPALHLVIRSLNLLESGTIPQPFEVIFLTAIFENDTGCLFP